MEDSLLIVGMMVAEQSWERQVKPMLPPLRPGARLLPVAGPVVETARLILRPWRASDIAPNKLPEGTAHFSSCRI
jgi:hypothetical protein